MNDASTLQAAPATKPHAAARALRGFWLAALCVVVLDQLSKSWVRAAVPLGGEAALVPGWVHFTHVRNLGAAWNVLSGQRWLLVAVAIGVIAFVASVARDVANRGSLSACALGLILGGALGNLFDRIAQGYVTDFIDLDTPVTFLRIFPVWNIADAALTIGAILMLLSLLKPQKHKSTEKKAES